VVRLRSPQVFRNGKKSQCQKNQKLTTICQRKHALTEVEGSFLYCRGEKKLVLSEAEGFIKGVFVFL